MGETGRKLKLSDLNAHLMCVLCGGYYIDATTIIECLHSFCRSCIVKHLESSRYCPICDVQVHKTRPLSNIRPDKTLQDIVYKVVPGLFASEMRKRRKFYRDRPDYVKPVESADRVDMMSVCLAYSDGEAKHETRYLRCPRIVTVYHLAKLLRAKYGLTEKQHRVELWHEDRLLPRQLTLAQAACISTNYAVKQTLHLTFRIHDKLKETWTGKEEEAAEHSEVKQRRIDNDDVNKDLVIAVKENEGEDDQQQSCKEEEKQHQQQTRSEKETSRGEEEKEFQLQISESGVMSVSQVQDGGVVKLLETPPAPTPAPTPPAPAPAALLPPPPPAPPQKPKKYKTIRQSPKTWHPVITKEKLRPTLIKSDEPVKPAKFFKMRNVPRFLGNPSSGVKPLYAGECKNQRIVKIDPKTLKPIDKSPQPSNLLTNPFIPNSNHFLFSDPLLLPPSPNGARYPSNPYAAVRPSPFSSYPGYHSAGFHASLPPSISLLLNPHQHFKTHGCDTPRKTGCQPAGSNVSQQAAKKGESASNSAQVALPTTLTTPAAHVSPKTSSPVAPISPNIPTTTSAPASSTTDTSNTPNTPDTTLQQSPIAS